VAVSPYQHFCYVPLLLVSACNPPLIVAQGHIVLRAIRKRTLTFDCIDGVLYEAENHLLGIELYSGEIVLIPWHLIDDPSAAYEGMCNILQCDNNGLSVVDR